MNIVHVSTTEMDFFPDTCFQSDQKKNVHIKGKLICYLHDLKMYCQLD